MIGTAMAITTAITIASFKAPAAMPGFFPGNHLITIRHQKSWKNPG